MKPWIAALSLVLALTACAPTLLPDTAVMPRTLAGTPALSDEGAMYLSSYALGVPSRTAGDAVSGARAVASIDYLAGALSSNPRWLYVSAATKGRMVQGRAEVRKVLGIDPRASSQEVVDRLMSASNAIEARDSAAAAMALSSPVFTLGPRQTLAMLTDLPYLPAANVAAQNAARESVQRTGSKCRFGRC